MLLRKKPSVWVWGILCLLFFGLACKKTTLPEERDGTPVVVLSGSIDGSVFSFSAGLDSVVAETDIIEQNEERHWEFTLRDHLQRNFQTIDILIRNHQFPFQGAQGDLNSTVKVDSFNYAFILPPINADPYQTGRVEINYTDPTGISYESLHLLQPEGHFTVVSTNPIVRDGKSYLLTEVNFDCFLVNTDSLDTIRLRSIQANILFGGVN